MKLLSQDTMCVHLTTDTLELLSMMDVDEISMRNNDPMNIKIWCSHYNEYEHVWKATFSMTAIVTVLRHLAALPMCEYSIEGAKKGAMVYLEAQ